jgi:acyl-coenzyme A synthetase/AMP-(fatty) acid ligase
LNFVEDVLDRFPASREAMVSIDSQGERRTWHFGELSARATGLSGALADRGIRRGDVVMTLIGNRPEWVLAILACLRMGAVALPCNPQLRRHDLELRARAAEPALVVAEESLSSEIPAGLEVMTLGELAEALDEERAQSAPPPAADLGATDPALIIFTSGSAGEPKGVVHLQRYLGGQRTQAERWLGAREGDLVWCTAASGWSKSIRNNFVAPWLMGSVALLQEGRFDPEERLGIIEREGVNVVCQAPTEYRMLAGRAALRPLPPIRRMVSAGEPLDAATIDAFRTAVGKEIHDGYGQTETGQLTGNLDDEPVREGSMGRGLPEFELRVTEGELQVKASSCPTFFGGYLGEEPYAGEWWRTGDLVREDEDGYLWFEGRRDDLIISAGYRIGPFEVESALMAHPAVTEAAVVGVPDPERGSVVKAYVVASGADPGVDLVRELQAHAKRLTAPYKYPRQIEFVEALPKTPSGKIRRGELR